MEFEGYSNALKLRQDKLKLNIRIQRLLGPYQNLPRKTDEIFRLSLLSKLPHTLSPEKWLK